ncbi:MAG: hypothetical protein ABFS16_12620 [Bacteroidota bacterium]
MKRTQITILFLLLTSVFAAGQNSGVYWDNLDLNSNRLQGKIMGEVYFITPEANNYFFLHRDWLPGKVVLTDGDEYRNIYLRYLALYDELIAYNENINVMYKIDKELVKSFVFAHDGTLIKFIRLPFKSYNSPYRFFHELYAGSQLLLAYHYVSEVRISPYKDKYGIMRDTEFRQNTDYYMYSGESGFKKLQPKRRAYIKAFPEHKKEIKKIFRKNRLVIVDEASMIQAFMMLDENGLLN